MVDGRLAGQIERSREPAFRLQSTLDAGLHDFPDLLQVIPDFRALAHVYILPVITARALAPVHDLVQGAHRVDFSGVGHLTALPFGQGAPADTVAGPFVQAGPGSIEGLEQHPVGMVRQEGVRFPQDLRRRERFQRFGDSDIGHVPLAGRRQASVQRHFKRRSVRMTFRKHLRSPVRAHGMAG